MPLDDKKDSQSPATTSLAYDIMIPRWEKIESLLGGTETMRAASTQYLPQHAEEGDAAYQERLRVATLFNMTELTLDSWVGRPFSDPVKLSDDMPKEMKTLLDDVDLQGNNIDVFARNWFRDGLAKSFSHVLVDSPRPIDEALLGRPRTLADDRAEGLRPYWIHIRPENLIFAHAEVINGQEVLTHIRIKEVIVVKDGFSEQLVEKIRTIDAGFTLEDGTTTPALLRIYRKKDSKKKKEEWELEEGPIELGVSFIPLVTFYADREGFMVGNPPPTSLADLNIKHWQGSSDQTMTLTVARFPMLAVSGAIDAASVKIGPHQILAVPDPTGKWYYVEHTGKAIAAGRQDLQDLIEQMAEYGAEFLKKRPSRETALARMLDSAEATSPLQDVSIRFNDALNTLLLMTNAWLGKTEQPGTAGVAIDFGPESVTTGDLDALKVARQGRDLSQKRYLAELLRRGILADDFDPDANLEELSEEEMAFAKAGAETEIDEGATE